MLSTSADNRQVAVIVRDFGEMIDVARQRVVVTANATLTTLFWRVGHHVRTQVLEGQRAAYGAKMVAAVGRQLAGAEGERNAL